MPDEIKFVLDRLAVDSAKNLESLLQELRDMCTSDEDFKRRTFCEQREGKPYQRQYLFDGMPVFYTELRVKDNHISFQFHQGSMYDHKQL